MRGQIGLSPRYLWPTGCLGAVSLACSAGDSALWTFCPLFALVFRQPLWRPGFLAAPPAAASLCCSRTARARTKALFSAWRTDFHPLRSRTIVVGEVAPLLIIPVLGLSSPMFRLPTAIRILVMVALALKIGPLNITAIRPRGVVTSVNPIVPRLASSSLKKEDDDGRSGIPAPARLRWGR